MKIYFNNLGIETSRVLDDVFVKNDVGRRIEAYFDGVDISSANISARLIIEWPNGDTTNALLMTKFIDASGFYIILPQLIQDGTVTFTIRITNLLEDLLQNTPQFTREILESVDAADDTNITPAEYAEMQNAINENASNIIASLNAAKSYSDAQLNARLRVLNVDDISDENTILELYSDLANEYEETGEAVKFNFVGEDQGGYKYLGNVNADFGESGDPMWITFFTDGNIYYYYLHDTGEEIDAKAVQFETRNTTTTLTNEDKLITSAAVKAVTDLCARTTYVDALIQQIQNGTIIAKKAECDKDGNQIDETYAKVDGNNVYTGIQRFDDAVITIPLADQPTKPVRLSQLTDAIGKLQDGTTIVGKANKDRLGNVIDSTYAHTIVITANSSTYQYTFSLLDAQGNTLNSQVIDLPLESVVVGGEYDSTNKAIILTLKNGQEIEIPVGDLVEGLQTEITPSNKLASDLVDDTNQTHKFVTAEEKAQITANKNEIADVKETAEDALDRTSVHDDEIMQLTIDLDNVEARLDLAKFNKSDVDTSIANPTSDTKVLSEKVVVNELNKVNEQIDILKVRVRDLEKNVFDVVEDNSVKYQKVIPNNVLTYGGLSKLGGLTKKYNQLYSNNISTTNGISIPKPYYIQASQSFEQNVWNGINTTPPFVSGHKYLVYIGTTLQIEDSFVVGQLNVRQTSIVTVTSNLTTCGFVHKSIYDAFLFMLVDLTTIYGAGNEPTTVDQFLTDYPKFRNYVPYTTGALDYAYIKKVILSGTPDTELLEAKIVAIKNKLVSLSYSADVLGYGLPNVYNYIDLENKKVVLNMGGVDLGTLTFNIAGDSHTFYTSINRAKALSYNVETYICSIYETVGETSWTLYTDKGDMKVAHEGGSKNFYFSNSSYENATTFKTAMNGVPLIYELETPVEIDVSDILDNDDVIGELESGGTITFENDNRYNLPSNVTYLVEVE